MKGNKVRNLLLSFLRPPKLRKQPKFTRISSFNSGRTLVLSGNDVRVIKRTWQDITDKDLVAHMILRRIFAKRREISKVYGIVDLDYQNPETNSIIESHAKRLKTFLTTVCENMDKMMKNEQDGSKDFVRYIRLVGRRHTRIQGVQFTAENWLLFKTSIIEVICVTEDTSNENYQSWSRLMNFVVSELKDAYILGVMRQNWKSIDDP